MKKNKVLVEMFGSEDWIETEFFNNADKELVENIIKENIIRKAKQEKYFPIAEPVIVEDRYLKRIGEGFMPVPDKAQSNIIVLHTTVKVTKKDIQDTTHLVTPTGSTSDTIGTK